MNTAGNPLWSTLDAFQVDLPSCGTHAAMRRLVASLAHYRSELPSDVWKASCAAIGPHPAVSQLLEDPYSRDARIKPAGYAGDARTLDYVYLRDPGLQRITSAGRVLFDVSTGVPIAAAVRDRSSALADFMTRRAQDQEISVASIACGHARELDKIPDAARSHIRFWGIDQDAKSVDHCRSRLDPTRATFEVGSVRDILAGRIRIPSSDFVYASGLFDYLDQRAGAVLVKRMLAAVKKGGSVVVPNLTPYNEELGYMEAIMDWWMSYRTDADLRELASVPQSDTSHIRTATFFTSQERVAWLQIDRLA